GCARSEPKILT
nr:Chain B, Histone-lysine N-methyltransferase MLL2 [Homo sapiens]